MITSNDKKVVAYNGDYKPVNIYSGRKKVSGYKEEEYTGKHIEVDDTYNDVLDVAVQGRHEQESRKAVFFNQLVNGINVADPVYGVSRTRVNNYTLHYEGNATYSTTYTATRGFNVVQGHKYFFSLGNPNLPSFAYINTQRTGVYCYVYTATDSIFMSFGVYIIKGNDFSFDVTPFAIDLTAMFGEGHEPTAEQFRKMFPCNYYPYNAGEWIYAPKGQWVKFNQGFKHGDILKDYLTWEGNVSIINGNFPSVANSYDQNSKNYRAEYTPIVAGHVYFTCIKWLSGRVTKGYIVYNTYGLKYNKRFEINPNSTIREDATIEVGRNLYPFYRNIVANTEIDNLRVAQWYVDLTEMFGEGNEPKTVEEFKALYPNEYYEYTEGRYEDTGGFVVDGEVVPNDVDTAFMTPMPELPEEVKAVEDPMVKVTSERAPDGYDEQEVTLPFTLYGHDGVNDECEPCVLVDGEWKCRVTRRWGKVDMGTLNIFYQTYKNANIFQLPNIGEKILCGVYCSRYSYKKASGSLGSFENAENGIYFYNNSTGNFSIAIKDAAFNDAESFIASVKGVSFIYELKEPIIEYYDPIPIRTLPIHTIVECDAEMRARIKRVE